MTNVTQLETRHLGDHHDEQFPTLPEGMERDGFIRLFQTAAPSLFHLNDAEIATFVRMTEDTRPSDWKSSDREPVCYRRQGEVARRRHLHRTSISRHERKLVKAKLIDKRTMADGRRSGFVGCGIFFSAAIALVPVMLDHKKEQDALDSEHNLLCNTRSIHKGHLKTAINDLVDLGADTSAIQQEYATWPDARDLRRMDIELLRQHVKAADILTQKATSFLEESNKLQHRSSNNATPYIQDTTQDFNSVCNASDLNQNAGKPAQDQIISSGPNGPEDCSERKCEPSDPDRNDEIRLKLSGPILYEICSPDMRFYIEARAEGRQPTTHDISCAAIAMLRELGINNTAWNDACEVMGTDSAILALIITDANRFVPEIRVRNPGGYLRGMTAAARAGTLNLYGSLRALQTRFEAQE